MSGVVILGGGPAGVAAAYELAKRGLHPRLVEARDALGGNAGSFELAGLRVDFGSHRLHPASDPEVLRTLRELLGADLLERPRHGRIRLLGRWIHFPLRPVDLALRMHPRFVLGVGVDAVRKLLPARAHAREESFASVLERGLGRTICREFYFPYARKIWGLDPEAISPIQAYKRVSSGSLAKMLRRLLPGGTGSGAAQSRGIFYYPRGGYGQISERLGEAAEAAGAELRLRSAVRRIVFGAPGAKVEVECGGRLEVMEADQVWSTIPLGPMVHIVEPKAPQEVEDAARRLELRAMLLVYLVLEQDRFTEYDAHYFPETEIPFTRLSEPKNYAALSEPAGRTVLCAEIPCRTADPLWSLEPAALGEVVREGLARAGLPIASRVLEVAVRRLPAAYPIYRTGYEAHFARIDRWLDGIPRLLSFGRQGLFAHDNTHHAIFMAQAAARCLAEDGRFDTGRWAEYRRVFETHVVED